MIYMNRNLNDLFDKLLSNDQNFHYSSTNTLGANENNENYEINFTKDGAYVFFEVPGYNKTNLKVEMEDQFLYLEGERTYKSNGKEKTKSMYKKFRIGEGYDPKSLEATIEDGILTVFIPNFKKQEKKRISIL